MRSAVAVAGLALVALLFGATLQPPPSAQACSLVGLSAREIPGLVERTPIIAIGTWIETGEYEATLVVDESLKGTDVGARHKFDNRQTYTRFACSPYEEDFHSGFRFKDGERSLVFMEKQLDGLWQVGWSSYAAFDVPPDDFAPMPMWPGAGPAVSLDAVKRTVIEPSAAPIADVAALETSLGCEPPHVFNPAQILNYTALAASGVALITVVSSPPLSGETIAGEVVVRIDDVLAGGLSAGGTISLNDHWISDYELENCEPKLESGRRGLREGVQYLAFLRPDEFGVAEFRAAAWGKAIISVNERYLTGDQPTLAEIRRMTGAVAAAPSATATTAAEPSLPLEVASSVGVEDDPGGFDWLPLSLAGLACAAAAGAAWLVFRSRNRSA